MSLARAQLDAALDAAQDGVGESAARRGTDHALPLHAQPEVSPNPYPSSEIGSLTDLLGSDQDRSARVSGTMVCPCCSTATRRVVRVRPGGARRWVAACALCAGKLLAGNPATLVGGHVRPRTQRVRRAG